MAEKTDANHEFRNDFKRMPLILLVGEFMLAFVLLRYLLNFTSMVSPTEGEWIQVWANLQSIIVSLLMAVLTVSSIIGIPSAKPQSWRKVVRSSVLLFLINGLYEYLENHNILISGFVFDIRLIAILMVIVVLIMFLPQVRKYYTPPMMDMPPLKVWALYLLNVPMDMADSFKFKYADNEKETE